jgi:hypothetical protein
MKTILWILTGVLLSLASAHPSWGQLFGPRTFGQPLTMRMGPGMGQQMDVGSIQGSERFLRGNRSAADFVGGDAREARTFVGSQQANPTRRVRTAVEGLRERRSVRSSLNQPRGPLKAGEMYERLSLSPDFVPPSQWVTATVLSERLALSLARLGESGIEASIQGRTAILRGTVASARNRELAELMVRMEPGISQVQNRLVVGSAQGSPERLLPPPPR